jgi:hypothetical protein
MELWWIGLPSRRVRSSIFGGIRGIQGSLLSNRCRNEAISLMFGKGEKRLRGRKEIHAIVPADGW